MSERKNLVRDLINKFDLPNSSSEDELRSTENLTENHSRPTIPANGAKPVVPPKPSPAVVKSVSVLRNKFDKASLSSPEINATKGRDLQDEWRKSQPEEDSHSDTRSSSTGVSDGVSNSRETRPDTTHDRPASDLVSDGASSLEPKPLSECKMDSSFSAVSTGSSEFSDEFQSQEEDKDETDVVEEKPPEEATKPRKNKSPHAVIDEILTTERKFVDDLDSLKMCYEKMVEVNEKQDLGLEKKITEVFSDFHQIYELHKKDFLPLMEERYAAESEPWIGKFFHDKCYIVKTYKPFIIRQDENKTLLLDLLKNATIHGVIADLSNEDARLKLGFVNVYNVIFQRITRYPMLLKGYIERLPEGCPDAIHATQAMLQISSESKVTNEIMRNVEDFNQRTLSALDKIQDGRLIGLQPWEKFVREGPVLKISARRNERIQERFLFLFTGRLILCYISGLKYKVSHNLEITTMEVQEISDPDRHKHSFRVRSKNKILDVKFENQETADEWRGDLTRVISEDRKRKQSFFIAGRSSEMDFAIGKQAPEWIKDEHCSMCMICYCKFSMINRKHHCRACGKIVCGPCSNYKHQLEFEDNEMKRVCRVCKNFLETGKEENQKPKDKGNFKIEERLGFSDVPNRQFRDCYVQLNAEGSIYIKSKIKDVKPEKVIPIVGFKLSRWGEVERCFRLCHPSCEYFFTVSSDERYTAWIENIEEVLSQFD